MSFFLEKEVCPACNGEKTLVSCGCGDDEGCTTMICPYCQGNGVIKNYNMPRCIIAMAIVTVAALAVILSASLSV